MCGGDLLVGAKAIALYLDRTEKQIEPWIAQDLIPTFRIGGTVCTTKTGLSAFFEAELRKFREIQGNSGRRRMADCETLPPRDTKRKERGMAFEVKDMAIQRIELKNGRIMASFTLSDGGFLFRGCTIMAGRNDRVFWRLPAIHHYQDYECGVQLHDREHYREIAGEVRREFIRTGGNPEAVAALKPEDEAKPVSAPAALRRGDDPRPRTPVTVRRSISRVPLPPAINPDRHNTAPVNADKAERVANESAG